MKKLFSPAAFFGLAGRRWLRHAEPYVGMAKPWQLGFQPPATPVMEQLYAMHDYLLVLITAISVFVLLLLTYICLRYHHKRNPVASKTTHNTKLEIIWTIAIFILVVIAIPSLRLHYYMQRIVDPDLTVKVTGYQWYWHYDYPDNGGFGFDSYIKKGADLQPGDIRQLAVDNALVVPVNTKVRVLITGADVIHSWAVPAFGVKKDAVPGRLNETWFEATKIGTFYGQCSQLCGVGHGFMPIAVQVVSKDDFAAWVKAKQPLAPSPTPIMRRCAAPPPTTSNADFDTAPQKRQSGKPAKTEKEKARSGQACQKLGKPQLPPGSKAADDRQADKTTNTQEGSNR